MCRFLLAKTTSPVKPEALLRKFSNMAEKSRAPDGDWQGDGWGISCRQENKWFRQVYLAPIWQSKEVFSDFPKTDCFLIHARSASFVKDKGKDKFNQPYVDEKQSFVFNGLLNGVAFPRKVNGEIGAQKIWSLVQEYNSGNCKQALEKTIDDLNKYAKSVNALNLGVSNGDEIFAYCQFKDYSEYYTLRLHRSDYMTVICSEVLAGLDCHPLEPGKIYSFS